MSEYNTKFKDGDFVLLGPTEECCLIIEKVVRATPNSVYPIEVKGYSYFHPRNEGKFCDNIILSEDMDRVLTDSEEKAFWLLRMENAVSEDG